MLSRAGESTSGDSPVMAALDLEGSSYYRKEENRHLLSLNQHHRVAIVMYAILDRLQDRERPSLVTDHSLFGCVPKL